MNDIIIIIIPNEILIFFHKLGDLMSGPILNPIYPKKKKNKKLELIVPNKKENCFSDCTELDILPIKKTVSKYTCGFNQVIPEIANIVLYRFLLFVCEI